MTRTRGVIHAVLAGVLVAAPFIGLFYVLERLGDVPQEIEPIPLPELVAATRTEEYDERPVVVRVQTAPGQQLRAPDWNGLVQLVSVAPGSTVKSGDPIAVIDGVTRLALGSPLPFSKALRRGDRGPEVADLQRALGTLGYPMEIDARFGASTDSAVRDLQADSGLEPSGVFTPDLVVWLPAESLTVEEVALSAGTPAPSQGSVIVESPAVATAGRVLQPDGRELSDLLNGNGGGYELTVGQGFHIGALGEHALPTTQLEVLMEGYADGRIDATSNNDGTQRSEDQGQMATLDFPGTIRLISPAVRWSLPASAVVGSPEDPDAQCVFIADDGSFASFRTTVVTGGFGWVAVEPAPLTADLVLANPIEVLDDVSCG